MTGFHVELNLGIQNGQVEGGKRAGIWLWRLIDKQAAIGGQIHRHG
jgi:hypothetical protein